MEIWASQKIRLADLGENRRVEICSSPPLCSCGPHTITWISTDGQKENLGSKNSCSRWPPISRGHVKETLSHEKRSLKENRGILLLQAKASRLKLRFGLFQQRKCQVRMRCLGRLKPSNLALTSSENLLSCFNRDGHLLILSPS